MTESMIEQLFRQHRDAADYNGREWKKQLSADVMKDFDHKIRSIHPETVSWAENLGTNGFTQNLILVGNPGTHKSTDAELLALHAYQASCNSNTPGLWGTTARMSMLEYDTTIKELNFFNAEIHKAAYLRLRILTDSQLLIMDDFGTTATSVDTNRAFWLLVEARSRAQVPLVLVSNNASYRELLNSTLDDRLRRAAVVKYTNKSSR